MLNKLLKRCMPWMDKGRWYHVSFKGNELLSMDPIFDHVDFQETVTNIYIKDGYAYALLDSKSTVSGRVEDVPFNKSFLEFMDNPTLSVTLDSDGAFITVYQPISFGITDYWFFMKPLER